jgi:tRNA G26 N,N-dimethylase Trm1
MLSLLSANTNLIYVNSMDKYNRETGLLTLTLDDAHNYHRTADRIPNEAPPMEFYVEKLQDFGYEVSSVTEESLEVKAPENEIWELLSGQHAYL